LQLGDVLPQASELFGAIMKILKELQKSQQEVQKSQQELHEYHLETFNIVCEMSHEIKTLKQNKIFSWIQVKNLKSLLSMHQLKYLMKLQED
jgi:hypothetical protein